MTLCTTAVAGVRMPDKKSIRGRFERRLATNGRGGIEDALEQAVTENLDYFRYALKNADVEWGVFPECVNPNLRARAAQTGPSLSAMIEGISEPRHATLLPRLCLKPVDVTLCHNISKDDYCTGDLDVSEAFSAPSLMVLCEIQGLHIQHDHKGSNVEFVAIPFREAMRGISGITEVFDTFTDDDMLDRVRQRIAQSHKDVAEDEQRKAKAHYKDRWGKYA